MKHIISYYDDLPDSILKCSNVRWQISFDFPHDEDLIFELLNSEIWPKAIDPCDIVHTQADLEFRAKSIIRNMLPDLSGKRLLNIDGCELITQRLKKSGYEADNVTIPQLLKCHIGEYDYALMYDVIDHIDKAQHHVMLKSIVNNIKPGGEIICRCHPWTSRHGGHCYNRLNKAYAHMFLGDKLSEYQDFVVMPIYNPTIYYETLFTACGLQIVKAKVHCGEVPDLLNSSDVYNYLSVKLKYPAEMIAKWMRYIYIDYHLRSPSHSS